MTSAKQCAICEESIATEQIEYIEKSYKGHTILLPIYFMHCEYCGSDYSGSEESVKSKQVLLNWKKYIDKSEETPLEAV